VVWVCGESWQVVKLWLQALLLLLHLPRRLKR
jgi:hypothetical protein